MRELLPTATSVALLLNPTSPNIVEPFLRALQPAARTLGLQLHVLNAGIDHDFDLVFASLVQLRADALVIMPDVLFTTRSTLSLRSLSGGQSGKHLLLAIISPFDPITNMLQVGTRSTRRRLRSIAASLSFYADVKVG